MHSEELDALVAVYGEDAVTITPAKAAAANEPKVIVRIDGLCFHFQLPSTYPASSPPLILNAGFAQQELDQVYTPGEPVLLSWIELARETRRNSISTTTTTTLPSSMPPPRIAPPKRIFYASSQPILVNKSKFQGHAAHCRTREEAMDLIRFVAYEERKATHNMWAYRIGDINSNAVEEDYDDDGEDAAGKRLSLVLHSMQQTNMAVVVTRYYGGVQLGPSRFKYIMQSCREAIEAANSKQDV